MSFVGRMEVVFGALVKRLFQGLRQLQHASAVRMAVGTYLDAQVLVMRANVEVQVGACVGYHRHTRQMSGGGTVSLYKGVDVFVASVGAASAHDRTARHSRHRHTFSNY